MREASDNGDGSKKIECLFLHQTVSSYVEMIGGCHCESFRRRTWQSRRLYQTKIEILTPACRNALRCAGTGVLYEEDFLRMTGK